MILITIGLALLIWFTVTGVASFVAVLALNELIPGADTPYWPVFWLLTVIWWIVQFASNHKD